VSPSGFVGAGALVLLTGCSMMIDEATGPPLDWPALRIVEHHVSGAAMRHVRRVRHPGNHVYVWGLGRDRGRVGRDALPYPKSGGLLQ
jgi:hypothetical protein